jgi:hypothetical protein
MSQAARQHVSRYLTYFSPIGALGGFVSDVVQPLAPLSAYVFWASLAAGAGLIVGWLVLRGLRPRFLPPRARVAGSDSLSTGAVMARRTG